MKQEYRDNLRSLANFLLFDRDNYTGLPKFDMSRYFSHVKYGASVSPAKQLSTYCGTAACALGHAPFVEGLAARDSDKSWRLYGERLFGRGDYFFWCFSGAWQPIDPTPEGAGARILYYLDHGSPAPDLSPEEYYVKLYQSYLPPK